MSSRHGFGGIRVFNPGRGLRIVAPRPRWATRAAPAGQLESADVPARRSDEGAVPAWQTRRAGHEEHLYLRSEIIVSSLDMITEPNYSAWHGADRDCVAAAWRGAAGGGAAAADEGAGA